MKNAATGMAVVTNGHHISELSSLRGIDSDARHRSVPELAMGRDILALACPDWRCAQFAVDASTSEIIYANLPAIGLLETSPAVRIVKDRLVFADADSQRQYARALDASVAGWAESGVFLMRNPHDDEWVSVTVHKPEGLFRDVLIRRLGDWRVAARLVFVEFSSAASRQNPKAFAAFAANFGLTAAECELAVLLANGKSLAEIAAIRGAALSTIRQRAKQILAKTGSKRQSDIVRLIMALR